MRPREKTQSSPFLDLKLTSDVVQQKRREPPKEGSDETLELSQVQSYDPTSIETHTSNSMKR
jgi:hypothetical protein